MRLASRRPTTLLSMRDSRQFLRKFRATSPPSRSPTISMSSPAILSRALINAITRSRWPTPRRSSPPHRRPLEISTRKLPRNVPRSAPPKPRWSSHRLRCVSRSRRRHDLALWSSGAPAPCNVNSKPRRSSPKNRLGANAPATRFRRRALRSRAWRRSARPQTRGSLKLARRLIRRASIFLIRW